MMKTPRLLIAGTNSGVGKTTLSTAIMASLSKRGLNVQPFKVGPDYIDPGYHTAATGRLCRNLDWWMLGEETLRELFIRSAEQADISIIEGVMGLYDGIGASANSSSAHVAKILETPVILVLDVRSMARSAAAVVLGYQQMDPGVNISGVILNRVGSRRHYRILKEAIESNCRIPVVGYVYRQPEEIQLPERHLGLLPTAEKSRLPEHLTAMRQAVEEGIDFEHLIALAKETESIKKPENHVFPDMPGTYKVRLGLVQDQGFNFYYQDALDLLTAFGAELVPCSPLSGQGLPANLHGLYIGGGFPEMFLEELSRNTLFQQELKAATDSGMPVYAECGGLMYLTTSIIDFNNRNYPAAGLIDGRCRMGQKRAGLGYVTAVALHDSLICSRGASLRGHEFHYSTLELGREYQGAYRLAKWGEGTTWQDGVITDNILASYVHLHFAGCPDAARKFIESCEKYKNS